MRNGKLDQQECLLLGKGWAPVQLVANKLGKHVATVYRMVADDKLTGMKVGKKQFVSTVSVVAFLGAEAAAQMGLSATAGWVTP